MKRNKRLIFMTGGGTAGHVTANLALAEPLKAEGFTCMYLGMKKGIEYKLATQAGLPFRPVTSGRLHRNLNPDTLLLPFRVIKGTVQAVHWIRKEKPCLIFCKGGFVSWPVAAAGAMTHTTVILHESDMTPGLSNKLCVPFAKRVLTTFQDTVSYLPKDKALYTGTPIRASLTKGSREKGFELTGLDPDGKPVLMVIGGSSGAKALNDAVKDNLDTLLESFQIIHLYGSKNAFEAPKEEGYFSLAYASSELPDLYACADLALSRAGSNVINELLLLKIPALLVPLPLSVSRGDQILNAKHFESLGFAKMLPQEEMTGERLVGDLNKLYQDRASYQQAMNSDKAKNGTQEVLKVILEEAAKVQ